MDTQIVKPSQVKGSITAPGSKSYAQRAVAAALMAKGRSVLQGVEMCDDTHHAMQAAQALGAVITRTGEDSYMIEGGLKVVHDHFNIGESGLATRLMVPIASLLDTPITVTGTGSILRRPIGMIREPLEALGVKVEMENDLLPVTVCGPIKGGEIEADGQGSSQFITGLLMALPLAGEDTVLRVHNLKSIPYVEMTIALARSFGVDIEHNEFREFYIAGNQAYEPCVYRVEGDWSGASTLLVAGAVAGEVTVEGLNPLSVQADAAIITALTRAGAQIATTPESVTVTKNELTPFKFDATHCPDLFPALVALAANCKGTSVLTGASRLVHKESNRAQTLKEEFAKLGVHIELQDEDTMAVTGGALKGAVVESHNDHRIAMSLAVAALTAHGESKITGARAVSKSYPAFWADLDTLVVKK